MSKIGGRLGGTPFSKRLTALEAFTTTAER
jgi:hypothetical protein